MNIYWLLELLGRNSNGKNHGSLTRGKYSCIFVSVVMRIANQSNRASFIEGLQLKINIHQLLVK